MLDCSFFILEGSFFKYACILSGTIVLLGLFGMFVLSQEFIYFFLCNELFLFGIVQYLLLFGGLYDDMLPQIFVFFILATSSAEIVIGLAIIVDYYRLVLLCGTDRELQAYRQI